MCAYQNVQATFMVSVPKIHDVNSETTFPSDYNPF